MSEPVPDISVSPYLVVGEAAAYLRTTVLGVYSLVKRRKLKPMPGRPRPAAVHPRGIGRLSRGQVEAVNQPVGPDFFGRRSSASPPRTSSETFFFSVAV